MNPIAMHVSRRSLFVIASSLLLAGCISHTRSLIAVNPPDVQATTAASQAVPVRLEIMAPVDIPLDAVPVIETDVKTAPATNIDLWQRIRNGFQLNHEIDRKRVRQEIEWYRKHPDYIDRVVTRAGRHLFHIVEALEARGMPLEIALLPIIESAFDPFAYSHGRASGIWQFIPSTARLYGIRIDWWYDGRRDIPDSTEAAIAYLQDLYSLLHNDWLLALAAYNSGQGNLGNSIKRNQRAGKPIDFWSLKVLKETRTYVPRLLAISEIIAHPEKYQIDLKPIQNNPYWVEVSIDTQLDLAQAANLADISSEELYLLNAGFNQWSTHPDGPHRLLLPVDKALAFSAALAELPAVKRLAWQRHKIRSGDNLGTIARRYRTTVNAIKVANNLRGTMIRAGDSLTIPVASRSSSYPMTSQARLENSQKNLTKKFGHKPIQYAVKNGDSFWEISRKFEVGMRELARWNGMGTTDLLFPGVKLLIFNTPVATASIPAGFNLASGRNLRPEVIRKVNYRVRKGESLSLIADKFNLSVNNIKQWNEQLDGQKYIQPGDKITLFIDVTATK
ncbi:MAG: LysM peptidoglycan-binding domain-containing protein [Proteobacteria bacterium]|nr:LysM peptidoglycan-binding domain-containing protein [Pseudomonadota bacterium]